MEKRGLSGVVVTLIIITLSLVAIAAVWVVVTNIISQNQEDINRGGIFISMEIKSVKVSDGIVEVKVKRNSGAGEINGLKFFIGDGLNTQEFEEETSLGELAEKTFILNYDGLVKTISVAPVFADGKVGVELANKEFTSKEILKNLGAVSWWKFEDNPNDEIGGNHGSVIGNANFVGGVYGSSFMDEDGTGEILISSLSESLKETIENKDFSISFWWYPHNDPNNNNIMRFTLVGEDSGTDRVRFHTGVGTEGNSLVGYSFGSNVGGYSVINNDFIDLDEWVHIVSIYDRTNDQLSFWVNGVEDTVGGDAEKYNSFSAIYIIPASLPEDKLDEIIVFDKVLSDNEIKSLYKLDLR